MRELRKLREVGDTNERVRQGLDVEHLGSLAFERLANCREVLLIDINHAHAGFTIIVLK
jgi:hypothetical protein